MQQISSISDLPNQQANIQLPDGSLANFTFYLKPRIQRWLFDLAHPVLNLTGRVLTTHPNILRQWKNVINFGLAVIASDGADPFYIEDFLTGRITLYVLNSSEIVQIEEQVYGSIL
jgi:hypothetical protein